MYKYDDIDQRIVDERVAQFRDQTRRFLAGELTEDEFRPLRLQNGLYIQRYAPMLRIAIPYGLLSSTPAAQARAHRAQVRPRLRPLHHAPEHPVQLAAGSRTCRTSSPSWRRVEMHAIQTSGNCVRNITTDHFAGVAGDEIVDPRPYCELLRQWSTFHPEFAYLPRKFKIAVSGRAERPRRDAGARHRRARGAQRRRAKSASASWSAAAWAARRSSAT